jgi:putative Holliday junction resolvase
MSPAEGRVLALDLGQSTIGLALSDSLGITAQPLEPLRRVGPRKDLRRLARLIDERDVRTLVVGLPLTLSGEEGDAAQGARAFAEELQRRFPRLAVELWDERLTTVEAERVLIAADVRRAKRKRVVDTMAALLILQGYLDADAGPSAGERLS